MAAVEEIQKLQHSRIHGFIPDTFCFVEHEPVVTFGRGTPPEHLPRPGYGLPIVEISRGGLATYHGPGQLVGYGIIDLRNRRKPLMPDIHQYLRALEQALIAFVSREFGLHACRKPGETGVWIHEERKIASIGVSARRWVTAHGFALNVSTDLTQFEKFVPCGIENCDMTSIEREMHLSERAYSPHSISEIAELLKPYMEESMHSYVKGEVI